jgi:hypothetical protein
VSLKDKQRANLETISRSICMIRDTDLAADQLQEVIMSYHNNCPDKTTCSPRKAPWWNKKLSGLRGKTRRPLNTAKRTSQWDTYKKTLTCYNKEIMNAEWFSWRRYCQEITDVPGSAEIMKFTAKKAINRISAVMLHTGQFTQTGGGGNLKELFTVHFPDPMLTDDSNDG